MNKKNIQSLKLEPSALFRVLNIFEMRQAIAEPMTLALLSAPNVYEYEDGTKEEGPGMGFSYAKDFVCAMVDYICNSYSRKDPMSEEARKELAELILRRNLELTIADCRLFADMLVSNEIVTGRPGMEERRLIDVNKSGILEKLSAYKARRSDCELTMRNASGTDAKRPQIQNKPLSEWQLTHDYEGNVMPAGWDAVKYWTTPPSQDLLNRVILPSIRRKMARIIK